MTKLISLGGLLKQTMTVYREKFVLVVGVMVIPFLLLALNQLLVSTGNTPTLLLSVVVSFLAGVGILWAGIGLLISLDRRSEKIGIKEAYRLGWGKLLSVVWVAILTSFVIGGSFLLFVIPGVIFTIWFLFAQILAVVEEERGMRTLVKSREYVRNYFWPVLGRYFAMSVLLVVVYVVLLAIASFLSNLAADIFSFYQVAPLVLSILNAVVNILVMPLAIIYSYLIYQSLKQVKGEVVVPAKKQTVWYLVIGLLGWTLLLVMVILAFLFAASAITGFFVGQTISELNAKAAVDLSPASDISAITADLNEKQRQQLQAQIDTLQKIKDQLQKGNN